MRDLQVCYRLMTFSAKTQEATTFTTKSNMGARTLYPAPPCPDCSKTGRVKNTYYTKDNEILRNRMCDWCGHSWWTRQQPEANLDPGQVQIKLPHSEAGWRKDKKRYANLVSIELSSCTPSQSSSV
jgi:hypothetical protein